MFLGKRKEIYIYIKDMDITLPVNFMFMRSGLILVYLNKVLVVNIIIAINYNNIIMIS